MAKVTGRWPYHHHTPTTAVIQSYFTCLVIVLGRQMRSSAAGTGQGKQMRNAHTMGQYVSHPTKLPFSLMDLYPIRYTVPWHHHIKLGCLMLLSVHAPQYLADDVQLVADSGRRLLRSASDRTCVVPQTHNSFGDRSFSAAGPSVWNALPQELLTPYNGDRIVIVIKENKLSLQQKSTAS